MTHKKTGFFSKFHYLCLVAVLALGLITIIGSNGGDGGTTTTTPDTTPPTVSSTTPADNTTDVAVDTAITAIFSEEMDSSTITTDTFTVNNGSSNIAGTVAYSDKTATFTPTNDLENNTAYTATITTGAKDLAGNALAADYTWSFTTVAGPTTFNSGATIGDLLTYTIDTSVSPMTYSYEIVESDFNLAGTQGSGTLTQNQDGTYTPSNDPEASVILLPNTLVVGGADIDVGGAETTMLFAGVPSLTTNYTASEIAGTYNYINFSCDDSLVGGVCDAGYKSYYGTFKVNEDGTWEACDEGDIDDHTANPCQGTAMNGSWTDQGNGRISITTGGTEIGKAMLLPSSSGGKVIIIDLKNVENMQGPGILVGVKKQDITDEDLGGTYHFNDDDGGYGDVTVNNANNNYTGTQYDSSGNSTTISGSLTRNDPWNGWLRDDNNNLILILPSDGVWFQTGDQPNNDWITIGGQIP
ncbi:MAG: Ig-like domain-containing protein [Deltaproteobacteria bacterium]|nr:Ig-like domain-containing protein [Deltaproteobacteria bacterium]